METGCMATMGTLHAQAEADAVRGDGAGGGGAGGLFRTRSLYVVRSLSLSIYIYIYIYISIYICIYIYIWGWQPVVPPLLAYSMLKKVFSPAREYMFWTTGALMQARTPFRNMTWLSIVKLVLSCRREHHTHVWYHMQCVQNDVLACTRACVFQNMYPRACENIFSNIGDLCELQIMFVFLI